MTLLSLTKNGTNEAERTAKAGNKKVEFPADSRACKAVFLPNPGFKDIFFLGGGGEGSLGLSAEGTLKSASATGYHTAGILQ